MTGTRTGKSAANKFVAGLGWKARRLTEADVVHPSVRRRIDGTTGSAKPSQPRVGL